MINLNLDRHKVGPLEKDHQTVTHVDIEDHS